MVLLEGFPFEILEAIFLFACTDNGHTGRSILQVCRTFREVSRTTGADLRCIYVHGIPRLRIFLKSLEKREIRGRKVRSLMIAKRPSENQTFSMILLQRILSSVSPLHLRMLFVFLPVEPAAPTRTCFVLPVALPELTELTISGHYGPNCLKGSCVAPKLRSLHIARYTELPIDLGDQLSTFAPNLTYLKITNLVEGEWRGTWGPSALPLTLQSQAHRFLLFPHVGSGILIGHSPLYHEEGSQRPQPTPRPQYSHNMAPFRGIPLIPLIQSENQAAETLAFIPVPPYGKRFKKEWDSNLDDMVAEWGEAVHQL